MSYRGIGLAARPRGDVVRGWAGALVGLATLSVACVAPTESTSAGDDVVPARVASAVSRGTAPAACAWPSAVALTNASVGCSGALIAPNVVLYAAHCGTAMLRAYSGPKRVASARVDVDHCVEDPAYRLDGGQLNLGHDLAVCILKSPLPQPVVPIVAACEAAPMRAADGDVVFVGYGLTETGEDGTKYLGRGHARLRSGVNGGGAYEYVEVTSSDSGVGICPGDSGGPDFVRLADGTYRVLGIHSTAGVDCSTTGVRGHQSAAAFLALDWIETAAGVDLTPCRDKNGAWDGQACSGVADPAVGTGAWGSCTWGAATALTNLCTSGPGGGDAGVGDGGGGGDAGGGDGGMDASAGSGAGGDASSSGAADGQKGGASSGAGDSPSDGAENASGCDCRSALGGKRLPEGTFAALMLGVVAFVRRRRAQR